MEGFVGKEKDLEMDVLWDGEAVEVLQDRGDVVMREGVGEESAAEFWSLLRSLDGVP